METLLIEAPFRVYEDKYGNKYTSYRTHKEVVAYCEKYDVLWQNGFIQGTIQAWRDERATEKQLKWLHIHVIKHEQSLKARETAENPEILVRYAPYQALYNILVSSLKAGKKNIRLFIDTDFINFEMKYLNKNACIRVYERDTEPSVYFGTINPQGDFCPGQALKIEVRETLDLIAADPHKAMKESGIWSGRCSYCGQTLKNEHSKVVGYGEKCAENHGLKW